MYQHKMVAGESNLHEKRDEGLIEAICILKQANRILQIQLASTIHELKVQVKNHRVISKYREVIIKLQTENSELKSFPSKKAPQKTGTNSFAVSLSNLEEEVIDIKSTLAQRS